MLVYSVSAAAEKGERIRVQLSSVQQTTISSEISAKISDLPVREGEAFTTGQVLISFDCSLLTSQRNKADAAFEAAAATYKVNKKLADLGSLSALELDQSKAKVKETEAELEAMNTYVSKCTLRAPFAGRVAKLYAENYQYLTPGRQIMDIIDTSQLEVRLIVPSRWLRWLKTGSTFIVHIEETGKSYKAVVIRLNPRIDALSQSIALMARIDGRYPELLPGMSGWANFGK